MLLAVVLDVLGLDVEVVVVTACAGCLLDALLETACFTTFVLDVQLVVLLLLLLVVEELFHLLVNLCCARNRCSLVYSPLFFIRCCCSFVYSTSSSNVTLKYCSTSSKMWK